MVLQYNRKFFGQVSDSTLDYINKYIEVNLFENPIMDEKLQPVYKMLSTIRSITGATVLGFNLRSGIRELMQGM